MANIRIEWSVKGVNGKSQWMDESKRGLLSKWVRNGDVLFGKGTHKIVSSSPAQERT